MLYTQTIYNLLNIPDTVDEPTAYDLLGLAPFGLTPERVAEAVQKQKHMAFMKLPDPAYVPMLIRLGRDLERASELLADEHKRKEHDDYISDQLAKAHDPSYAKRSQAMIEARKGLDMLVRRDLVLADELRPKVMDKIMSIGLDEKEVRRLLNQVPKPAPFIPNLRNSIIEYYVDMVNLSRSLGDFEADQTRLKEIGASMLMFPGASTDQIIQQAEQADVTLQSVEMALEVNGGYVVDSAVNVDTGSGGGYADATEASDVSDGSATFSNMRMSGQSSAGSGMAQAAPVVVQADTIDIAEKQLKIPISAIVGISVAAVILVGFIIGGIYLIQSLGDDPEDDLPFSTATSETYEAQLKTTRDQYLALEDVPDGVRVDTIRAQIDNEFQRADRFRQNQKYDSALEVLGQITKRVGEMRQISSQSKVFEQEYNEFQPLLKSVERYSVIHFAGTSYNRARAAELEVNALRTQQRYGEAIRKIEEAEELYRDAISQALDATAP